ncbi:hypothetical protein [Arthrobacter sp. UM1]|uniref:hypothetical protein n=1 Tax=Arthrobacter sp. UM1 TaxID=2766776 RepID=UPI001CF66279|nr:hypothetical protein [Arthrobacter sp. UM1]MCB4208285.1 hypothetical protein [Arthrobacter sp. UM1]
MLLVALALLEGVLSAFGFSTVTAIGMEWSRFLGSAVVLGGRPDSRGYTSVLTSDVPGVARARRAVPDALSRCLVAGAAFIGIGWVSIWLAAVIAVFASVSYAVMVTVGRRSTSGIAAARTSYGSSVQRIEEISRSSRLISGLRAAEGMAEWHRVSLDDSLRHDLRVLRVHANHGGIQAALGGLSFVAFVVACLLLSQAGLVDTAGATGALLLFPFVAAPLPWLVELFHLRQAGAEGETRIAEILGPSAEDGGAEEMGAEVQLPHAPARIFFDTPLTQGAFTRLIKEAEEPATAAALDVACAREILDRFPSGGLDSGESPAAVLSGGQRQRLVLAKALAGGRLEGTSPDAEPQPQAPLVLDGALDSVDELTRAAILERLSAMDGVVLHGEGMPEGRPHHDTP